jgi:threonine/homoserine/homoserine lactone efflux protein
VAEGERVTGDIKLPASETVEVARPSIQPTAEGKMRTTIIKSVALSVPLAIAFFVGLVALAVHNQQPDWNAWISMAAGIGVIAGVFFGLLLGFTLTSHKFE